MKGFIEVTPVYPNSHYQQKVIRVNVDNIVSFGEVGEDCSYLTTVTDRIYVEESYAQIERKIKNAQS